MTVKSDELFRRVKSARMWLEKAEQSFGNQAELKGELNLMLAQAEMQKLKEQRNTADHRFRRHGAAILAAFCIVGVFGWHWLQPAEEISPQVQPTTEAVSLLPARDIPAGIKTEVPLPKLVMEQPKAAESAPVAEVQYTASPVPAAPAPSAEPVTETVRFSNAEINSMVSDAGKVLRGKE